MADAQVRAILRGLEGITERVVVKITLDVAANLVETTPVDTGWARANWVPSMSVPVLTDLSNVKPTSQAATSASSQQQAALSGIVGGYKLARGKVFVTNNVPYIGRLNDGSSVQAPSGFIQAAIRKAVTRDILGLAI